MRYCSRGGTLWCPIASKELRAIWICSTLEQKWNKIGKNEEKWATSAHPKPHKRTKMKRFILVFVFFFAFSGIFVSAQSRPAGYALEVTYVKGRPFAYQRIGQWAWYALFARVEGWKPAPGEMPVDAVKITPRVEEGLVKVRVTVLKGKFLETELPVGDYPIAQNAKLTLDDLSKFGVVPFEVALVIAPATISELPAVVNQTKSLQASVAPDTATLPTFQLKLLNNSTKPVRAFTYETVANGRKRISAMPNKPEGGILIPPGQTHEEKIRVSLDSTTTSTGEVPAALKDVTVMITSVIFADGTFEGDVYQASRYRAFMLGERTQVKRILDFLRTDLTSVSMDILSGQVSDMTWYADEPAFENFVNGIGGLNEKAKDDLRETAEVMSSSVKRDFVAEFGEKRTLLGDKPAEFQAWLKAAAERYQKWLSALPQ